MVPGSKPTEIPVLHATNVRMWTNVSDCESCECGHDLPPDAAEGEFLSGINRISWKWLRSASALLVRGFSKLCTPSHESLSLSHHSLILPRAEWVGWQIIHVDTPSDKYPRLLLLPRTIHCFRCSFIFCVWRCSYTEIGLLVPIPPFHPTLFHHNFSGVVSIQEHANHCRLSLIIWRKIVLIELRIFFIVGFFTEISHTVPQSSETCNISGFHCSDYEECRLLRCKNPVRTSQ
jgi:hypothetical protein